MGEFTATTRGDAVRKRRQQKVKTDPPVDPEQITPGALELLGSLEGVELPFEVEEGLRSGTYVAYRYGGWFVRNDELQVDLPGLLAEAARNPRLSELVNRLARELNKKLPANKRVALI